MLTREQIEEWREDAPATRQMLSSADFRALCDLALAALELRERSVDPMENWLMKPSLEWLEQAEHGENRERCKMIAAILRDLWRIRALPLTPSGADQQNSPPEQELPASSVSAASVSPHRGSLGSEAPDVQQPARAGEPRCHDLLRTISGEPYFCLECGSSLPMDGSCWRGRTQA